MTVVFCMRVCFSFLCEPAGSLSPEDSLVGLFSSPPCLCPLYLLCRPLSTISCEESILTVFESFSGFLHWCGCYIVVSMGWGKFRIFFLSFSQEVPLQLFLMNHYRKIFLEQTHLLFRQVFLYILKHFVFETFFLKFQCIWHTQLHYVQVCNIDSINFYVMLHSP